MKNRIAFLEKLIEENQLAQLELQKQIRSFELDPDDYTDSYEELLDCDGPAYLSYYPSQILRDCDPIAYREGLLNYVDSLDRSDVSSEYKSLEDELEVFVREEEELQEMLGDAIDNE